MFDAAPSLTHVIAETRTVTAWFFMAISYGCGSSEGTSCGSWNGAVEVAGLVDALLFLTEVPCPIGVEVAVAV